MEQKILNSIEHLQRCLMVVIESKGMQIPSFGFNNRLGKGFIEDGKVLFQYQSPSRFMRKSYTPVELFPVKRDRESMSDALYKALNWWFSDFENYQDSSYEFVLYNNRTPVVRLSYTTKEGFAITARLKDKMLYSVPLSEIEEECSCYEAFQNISVLPKAETPQFYDKIDTLRREFGEDSINYYKFRGTYKGVSETPKRIDSYDTKNEGVLSSFKVGGKEIGGKVLIYESLSRGDAWSPDVYFSIYIEKEHAEKARKILEEVKIRKWDIGIELVYPDKSVWKYKADYNPYKE